jgi:c-di-GMP-binding flagellar brake protein YcgR
MENVQEKRKHKRLKAYHLVKYRPAFAPKDKLILSSIKNISAGGVCMEAKEKLRVGEFVQLYINFPWLSSPVPALAKVVWLRKPGRQEKYEYGLEFSEIEDIIRKDIHERIENVC